MANPSEISDGPEIKADLPDQIQYSGSNVIELEYPPNVFSYFQGKNIPPFDSGFISTPTTEKPMKGNLKFDGKKDYLIRKGLQFSDDPIEQGTIEFWAKSKNSNEDATLFEWVDGSDQDISLSLTNPSNLTVM